MSEAVFVRDARDYMSECARIARLERENRMLGQENERLNEGLEAMRAGNEVLTRECDALRRALREAEHDRDIAEAGNRRYRAQHAKAYEHVLAERAAGRKTRGHQLTAISVLILIGSVLTLAGISLFFWLAR